MHRRFIRGVIFFLALIISPSLQGAEICFAPTLERTVDRVVLNEYGRQDLVGVAVGIIHDGEIVYLKGFGWADREQKIPVTPSTMFRWASISKTLTAITALQLAEEGKLNLNADVCEYVPEFPEKGETITCRHLLCHQSGIVHYKNGKVIKTKREYEEAYPFKDVIVALDTFKESPLICKPGERFSYTTHGYILLSAAVQRAGEERFAEQVLTRIAKPLQMTSLQPDYQFRDIPRRAKGYIKLGPLGIFPSSNTDVSWKLGGGGFISNVRDLARYAQGLMRGQLVSGETEKKMWTAQTLDSGKPTTYGLGFKVEVTEDGRRLISHNGSQEKTRTRMVFEPRHQRGIVLMSNSQWANVNRLSSEISQALGWEPRVYSSEGATSTGVSRFRLRR